MDLQINESSVDAHSDVDISKSYTECLKTYKELLKLLESEAVKVGRVNVTKAQQEYGKLST